MQPVWTMSKEKIKLTASARLIVFGKTMGIFRVISIDAAPTQSSGSMATRMPAPEQGPQCHPIDSIYIRHSTVRNYWLIAENPGVIEAEETARMLWLGERNDKKPSKR